MHFPYPPKMLHIKLGLKYSSYSKNKRRIKAGKFDGDEGVKLKLCLFHFLVPQILKKQPRNFDLDHFLRN